MRELSKAEIRKLVQNYIREVLEDYEVYLAREEPVSVERAMDHLEALSFLQSDFKEALFRRDYRSAEHVADILLEEKNIELSKDSDSYKMLCREMLKAQIDGLDLQAKLERGEPLDGAGNGVEHNYIQLQEEQPEEEPSELLSFVIEKFVDEQDRSGNWNEKTKRMFITKLGLLQEVIGDVPIKSIDYQTIRHYREVLMKLPSNIRKKKQYRDKTIDEILKMEIDAPMSVKTINDYLGWTSTLFKYAARMGYIDRNPAEGLQLPKSKRADEYRSAFTKEDLEKIFRSEAYMQDTHRSSYCFWLPVMALFTGCRLEELCQLHLEDIRQEEGVWVLDINDKDEKKAKTKAAKRLVPLHPFLKDDLKLVQYAEDLRQQGQVRLFPELTRQRDGYGQTPSKWFRRYRIKCGVAETGKDFHSFRHTFVDNLKQAHEVNDVMISEVVGHEVSSMTMGRYGKRYRPAVLLEEVIKKLDYGVDLGHLKESQFVR